MMQLLRDGQLIAACAQNAHLPVQLLYAPAAWDLGVYNSRGVEAEPCRSFLAHCSSAPLCYNVVGLSTPMHDMHPLRYLIAHVLKYYA